MVTPVLVATMLHGGVAIITPPGYVPIQPTSAAQQWGIICSISWWLSKVSPILDCLVLSGGTGTTSDPLLSFNPYQSQAQAVQLQTLFATNTVSPLGFDLVQVVRAAPSVYAGCVMIQAVHQHPMVVHGIHLSFVSVQQDQHNYMMFPYGEVFPPGLFSPSYVPFESIGATWATGAAQPP